VASAQFSEFSFGFAYGREVVSKHWAALKSAPILPSLYDEGKDGGFDLAIGLYGWTYFAQFKRSDYLSRAKGPSSNYLGGPSAADPSAATLPGPGPRK
jgi:hypothetical protein